METNTNPPVSRGGVQPGIPPQNQPTAARRIRKAELQTQAMEYRLMGATFAQIAEKLGVSRTRAFEYVRDGLAENYEKLKETTEQYRRLQLARIERMLLGIMKTAAAGSIDDIDRVIKLHQEQRRLLPGLEVPVKAEIGGMTDENGNATGAPIKVNVVDMTAEEAGS